MAGTELSPELVLALGRAAARVLGVSDRPFLVGRDTRLSGPLLQAAFSAGVAAEGLDVVDLGVIPTPGVASEAARTGSPAAVVSASHNPFADNGVKLLAPGGLKLADAQEAEVEAILHRLNGPADDGRAGEGLGWVHADDGAAGRYVATVVGALEGRDLGGFRVVVDCGNGAAVRTARAVLDGAGAEVVAVLGDEPDGRNINAGCGSTDPSGLARAVVAHGAGAGLAFDGDADRVIAVDGHGEVVDGDRLLALFAGDLHERGRLHGGTVVVTVMTNLGFHRAMDRAGIGVAQTQVGDRYVVEEMEKHGYSLGGEQSGHIIFGDLATTGDGVLTGLLLLDLVARRGRPLAELAAGAMVRLPQVLRNVKVRDHSALGEAASVWAEVESVEQELGSEGRVLLRPSGTEKVVRVMVEAPTEQEARSAVERLAEAVTAALGP